MLVYIKENIGNINYIKNFIVNFQAFGKKLSAPSWIEQTILVNYLVLKCILLVIYKPLFGNTFFCVSKTV